MQRLMVLLALLISFLSPALFALDKKPLSAYARETWTTRNGLPHNQVNAVTQTPDGYLWFATWEGLVRYNGQDFLVYTPKNLPGLQDHGIRFVSTGAHGRLIVATSRGGVTIIDKGKTHSYGVAQGLAQDECMAAIEDRQGTIWVAHESKGISRIDPNGQITRYGKAQGLPSERMYNVYQDHNNVIWAGTANGMVRIENGRLQSFTEKQGLPAGAIYAFFEAPEGGLYLGSQHGLYSLHNGQIKQVKTDFPDEAIISLNIDKSSNLWMGTVNRGILRLGVRGLEELDASAGLPNNRVSSLFSDTEGNLWAGTNAGLVRFADTPFVTLNNYQGLSDNYVRAIAQANDGSLFIGTSRGLNQYQNEKINRVDNNNSLKNDAVLSLAPAKDGGIWVGMYSTGLINWKNGKIVEEISVDSPIYGSQVRALLEDSKGYLWVGTSRGVYRKKGQELLHFGESEGLPRDFITSLHESKTGRIWVGTANGAGYIDGTKAGAIDISMYESAQDVFGFSEDADGTLWLATDRAILRLREGKIRAIGINNGLPVATIFQIVTDTYNNFWLTSNRGVMYVKRANMEAVADGRTAQLLSTSFAEADGMGSSQCNGGAGPAALRANDGSIWVATAKGVSVVQPDELARFHQVPPPVVIESLMVDDKSILFNGKEIRLPSGTRKLELSYVSLTYRNPEQIRYRYKLEGFDNKWVYREQLRNVQFTNLPPGHYTFKVSAALATGAWSEQAASFVFTIEPKIYQRAWFIPAIIVLMGLLIYGVFQARLQQLKAREVELSNIVSQRTRSLQDKNIELEGLNNTISKHAEAFELLARTDSLTGLANRRSMDEKLEQHFTEALVSQKAFCFGIVDIDHFKRVNDGYSHQVGDQALKQVAQTMQWVMGETHQGSWRGSDLCARWGGEEFALIFPEQDLQQALEKCEKVRLAVEAIDCSDFAPGLVLSVSIGLTERSGLLHHEKMLTKADENLYLAKHQGRNQVVAI
jgi:diguanylate cyclase (GGDEF)-like protein